MTDLEIFQKILAEKEYFSEMSQLPCYMLPVTEKKPFFGGKEILKQIDEHLHPSDVSQGLKSMAIYDLGGGGKTQIYLAYAYSK